ncbi:hypothetical protein AVEN_60555-1 [Araneus ventricosus]|uniref:Uncharacterized protein n=1 Tax=Araneus ventricosus TaxID=182803 RepID=A0A4Y2UTI5_ARAVE|nr:hypothetical protein AVEN_60555-1 [Araneus ventricosus]
MHKWWMATALEYEIMEARHIYTSKIVDYRDIHNISVKLSHLQGRLPTCENHLLAPTTDTEDVTGPSIAQNTSEELSHGQSDLPVHKNVPLASTIAMEAVAGHQLSKTHFKSCIIDKMTTLNA